jgi:hypothetical protein
MCVTKHISCNFYNMSGSLVRNVQTRVEGGYCIFNKHECERRKRRRKCTNSYRHSIVINSRSCNRKLSPSAFIVTN